MEHVLAVNEHTKEKPSLFFFTGLNIPLSQYTPIYESFDAMNIHVIEVNQEMLHQLDDIINTLKIYIMSLEVKPVYFIAHSFSAILVYRIALQLPELPIKCVLLDPSTKLSIPSIERNQKLSERSKEMIKDSIEAMPDMIRDVNTMETLLITYINFKQLKGAIKSINRIRKDNHLNYERLIEFYEGISNKEKIRLTHFDTMYNNRNTHYVVLPLDTMDNLKKVFPHYIHLHRPKEIVDYINAFFSLDIVSIHRIRSGGGRKKNTKHTQYTKRIKKTTNRKKPSTKHRKRSAKKYRRHTRKISKRYAKLT